MRRLIEPCMVEIQPEALREVAAECLLRRDRERADWADRAWLSRLPCFDLRQRGRQEFLVGGEDRRHVSGADAWLEAVHQRVVRTEAERACQRRRRFAGQPQHLGQMRCAPSRNRRRDGPRATPSRSRNSPSPAPPPDPPATPWRGYSAWRIRRRLAASHGSDVSAAARSASTSGAVRCGMPQNGQHRELVAAGRAAARRHDSRGVPPQHGGALADRGDEREAGGQPFIGGWICHDRTAFRAQTPNMTTSDAASPYQVMTYDRWLFGGRGKCCAGAG